MFGQFTPHLSPDHHDHHDEPLTHQEPDTSHRQKEDPLLKPPNVEYDEVDDHCGVDTI